VKARRAFALAAGALVMTVLTTAGIFSASAQTSDAATVASPGQSEKSAKSANRALAKEVRRNLSKTKGLTSSNVSVRATDGTVTLAGTVPDATQIDKATEAVKSTPGVTSVRNALTIREPGQ
jgi:osmotically-inducible protein OsmY